MLTNHQNILLETIRENPLSYEKFNVHYYNDTVLYEEFYRIIANTPHMLTQISFRTLKKMWLTLLEDDIKNLTYARPTLDITYDNIVNFLEAGGDPWKLPLFEKIFIQNADLLSKHLFLPQNIPTDIIAIPTVYFANIEAILTYEYSFYRKKPNAEDVKQMNVMYARHFNKHDTDPFRRDVRRILKKTTIDDIASFIHNHPSLNILCPNNRDLDAMVGVLYEAVFLEIDHIINDEYVLFV